jgi:hypothetical protein
MTHLRSTRFLAPAAALTALLLSACADPGPSAPLDEAPPAPAVTVIDYSASGLEQEVRVEPGSVRVGDTITVRSTIRNTASTGRQLESRICGLDVTSSLTLQVPGFRCGGWSVFHTVAGGASFTLEDQRVVIAAGGSGTSGNMRTLRIRHLLHPERWVEVQVELRP